jgi:hypothetical protein
MGEVIDMSKRRKPSPETVRLFKLGADVDALIKNSINEGKIPVKDIAGLIAHRLGNFLGLIDKKQELFDVCVKIIKEQAKL